MKKNEKLAFFMGLSVGLAIFVLISLFYLGIVYAKNNNFFQLKKIDNQVDINKEIFNQDNNADYIPVTELVSVESLGLKEEKIDGIWTRGNPSARVTILEYSDPECPYCAKHHKTLKQIMLEYPNLVKWQYKHFPLDSIHPLARKASEATECAGEQNNFWTYVDLLYANQRNISNGIFSSLATKAKLNVEMFNDCLSSGKYKQKIADDLADGKAQGVKGTPGNFINGVELKGAVPFEQIKIMIDKELNK